MERHSDFDDYDEPDESTLTIFGALIGAFVALIVLPVMSLFEWRRNPYRRRWLSWWAREAIAAVSLLIVACLFLWAAPVILGAMVE